MESRSLLRHLTKFVLVIAISFFLTSVYPEPAEPHNFKIMLDFVDSQTFLNNVASHVKYLSSLGSRVTGQVGYESAARYIAEKFQEYGLKPGGEQGYFESYELTVPMDEDVRIVIPSAGITIKAYAMWPNNIYSCYTPPEGIEGILVYFGEGTPEEVSRKLEDLKLRDLSSLIALMEFNTQKNWLNLVNFGIKAIIFTEPGSTTRIEAETKFSQTPLLVPRVYVAAEEARILKGHLLEKVRIYSDMKYKVIEAKNVLGIIEGTKYRDQVIIVSSYFDSWSAIPRISPGADEATGVAVLLELARFFSVNKPSRTMWFVAFSGHWEALAGSRYFAERHYFAPEVQNDTLKTLVHYNLDFSTDSDTVAWVSYGSMWVHVNTAPLFPSLNAAIESDVYEGLSDNGFNVSKYVDGPTAPFLLSYFMHDAEPSVVAGLAGFTFRTSRSMRLHEGVPYDTEEHVKYENLIPQAKFAGACIYYTANVETPIVNWSTDHVKPVRRYMSAGVGGAGRKGYAGIYGDIARYDPEKRWYTSEGLEEYDVLLDITLAPSIYVPWAHIIVKIESNSSLSFRVPGIGTDYIFPETGLGAHYVGQQVGERGLAAVRVYAYALNRTTGRIEWAPDFGIWAWPQNRGFTPDREDGWKDVRVSLFRTDIVYLTDVVEPSTFEEPWVSANWRVSGFDRFSGKYSDTPTKYVPSMALEIRDFITHAEFLQWGLMTPLETGEPFYVLYVPLNSTFEAVLRDGTGICGVLINASREDMEGVGFRVNEGTLRISMPVQIANDLYWLNTKRLDILRGYSAYSQWAKTTYDKADGYYKLALKAREAGDYVSALGLSLMSWSWGARAYQELSSLIKGLTYTFVFFSVLLLPFALLTERMLMQAEGLKRLIWIMAIYGVGWAILSFAHPGSLIALSTPVAVMAFVQVAFAVFALVLLSGITGGYLQEIRTKVMGLHFADISRTGAFLMATSLGVQQMRRRRMRSVLSLITISLIAFALVLLTSASGNIVSRGSVSYEGAGYDGLLINNNLGIDMLGRKMADLITSFLGGTEYKIARRAWLYPPPFENPNPAKRQFWVAENGDRSSEIWAVLGLEPEEAEISGIDKALIGTSRWFLPDDMQVCIVARGLAERLGLELGSSLDFLGIPFRVVGIFDEDVMNNMKDLDGVGISPIDFGQIRIAMAGSPLTPDMLKVMSRSYRTAYDYLLILPYRFVSQVLYAPTYSIVAKGSSENLMSIAQEIPMTQYRMACFFGDTKGGLTRLYSTAFAIITRGWDVSVAPIIIASLMILDIMLGAVYERMRELGVLGSLGLSPVHVGGLLVVEALIYGVVGTVLGYIPGIIGCRILVSMGMIPEGFVPGFASTYILLISVLIMAIVLAGVSYPATKVSKMVTPGLLRKFRFAAKPMGNVQDVSLPFFAIEEEVYAVVDFMAEYFKACTVEGVAPFITLEVPRYAYETSGLSKRVILQTRLLLPPYDSNTTQLVKLVAQTEVGIGRYEYLLHMELLSGSIENWRKSVGNCVEGIRKQILLWRTLTDSEKARYLKHAPAIRKELTGE